MSEREILGEAGYKLLREYTASNGETVYGLENIANLPDEEIKLESIEDLAKLISFETDLQSVVLSLECARLLVSWGDSRGISYIDYFLRHRLDRQVCLSPHRIHGYDTTYEELIDSLISYYARISDRPGQNSSEAFATIFPLLSKILTLSNDIPISLTSIIYFAIAEDWRDLHPDFEKCRETLARQVSLDAFQRHQLQDLEKVADAWS